MVSKSFNLCIILHFWYYDNQRNGILEETCTFFIRTRPDFVKLPCSCGAFHSGSSGNRTVTESRPAAIGRVRVHVVNNCNRLHGVYPPLYDAHVLRADVGERAAAGHSHRVAQLGGHLLGVEPHALRGKIRIENWASLEELAQVSKASPGRVPRRK